MSILSKDKLYFPLHVFVVDSLATLMVDTPPSLIRFLVISGKPVLIEDAFLAKDSVHQPTCVVYVIVLYKYSASDE